MSVILIAAMAAALDDPRPAKTETVVDKITVSHGRPLIMRPGFEAPMMDYMRCRSASKHGTGVYSNGKFLPPPVAKGGDCTPARKKAAADAIALLEKAGVDKAARAAEAETMLADVDSYIDQPEPSHDEIVEMLRKQGKLPPAPPAEK